MPGLSNHRTSERAEPHIRLRPGGLEPHAGLAAGPYRSEQAQTNYSQASAYLTAMKGTEELGWLNEVSSVPLQQALRHQQAAFASFFAGRARYPRYKSRGGRQCAEYTRSGFRYRDGQLFLAKMRTPLAFAWSWPDTDPASMDPSTVTVSRDPCGRWYVSFAVEVPAPAPLPAAGAVVGVDLGIKDFAVTSDGEKIPNPRCLARRERSLARYQRRLARCQKGSANRHKARAKVARAHRKVRASRADLQDLLRLRAPARGAPAQHPGVAVPVLRHPARPGRQRREEHPGGRSCRFCLRS